MEESESSLEVSSSTLEAEEASTVELHLELMSSRGLV